MDYSPVPYLAEALRKGREKLPTSVQTLLGFVPGVSQANAVADMVAPSSTPMERAQGAMEFVPFGKLAGAAAGPVIAKMADKVTDLAKFKLQKKIADRLRKSQKEIPLTEEELEAYKTGQIPMPEKPPQGIIDSMIEKANSGDEGAKKWLEEFGGSSKTLPRTKLPANVNIGREKREDGWYAWATFGSEPPGDDIGPFKSAEEARKAIQKMIKEDKLF